MRVQSITLY
ncbi:hypothetical protein pdam_00014592 [Pocillopora damicornis]|uniref:Uncharacterized protein n=1 Tax=Pocillopora damicornis TaxID=46731 RepID=A0A3M6UHE9_POCDA|nr:hypothetical protein pdam_00014592 [Pocillopora damicornis]